MLEPHRVGGFKLTNVAVWFSLYFMIKTLVLCESINKGYIENISRVSIKGIVARGFGCK